jgi:hypothetical protein
MSRSETNLASGGSHFCRGVAHTFPARPRHVASHPRPDSHCRPALEPVPAASRGQWIPVPTDALRERLAPTEFPLDLIVSFNHLDA